MHFKCIWKIVCYIFSMSEIREVNEIKVNNEPLKDWGKVDNLATSDELLPQAGSSSDGGSLYARQRRAKKIGKGIGIAVISVTAVLTGGSLLSSFISDPILNSIAVTPYETSIQVEATIENKQGLKTMLQLLVDGTMKEEIDWTVKGSADFSYVFQDVDYSKQNIVELYFTNQIDYTKILFRQEIRVSDILSEETNSISEEASL